MAQLCIITRWRQRAPAAAGTGAIQLFGTTVAVRGMEVKL
jgi:hypothetical protein